MNTKSATQMADVYGMKSSVAFNKLLVKCGVLLHTEKGYVLAEKLRGLGLVVVIDTYFFLPGGIKATKKKAVWTEEGQRYIGKVFGRLGIVPAGMERDLFAASMQRTEPGVN